MADPEITALRAKLASRPRSDDYRQRRQDFDARSLEYRLAPDVTVEPATANGVRAEWTSTPQDSRDGAILYVHGGGYVIGSLDSHRHLVAEAGRAAGCWALALDYRLAPEHPFPAPVEDTVAGYRYLLGRGIQPGRIALGGDSAGGGLVVAAMVQKEGVAEMAKLYLNGADPRSPLAAPLYADLTGLAPVIIQVGAAETLLDDAIRLTKLAGAADVRVELQIWPEMVHVWPLFHPELKAGKRAIEAAGAFMRAQTSG